MKECSDSKAEGAVADTVRRWKEGRGFKKNGTRTRNYGKWVLQGCIFLCCPRRALYIKMIECLSVYASTQFN